MAGEHREFADITPMDAEKYSQHLKDSKLAVDTHNRKMKRIRKIFETLQSYRTTPNPFQNKALYRKAREEHGRETSRMAFTREQEQQLLNVLANPAYKVLNKQEIRVIYHIGMYTGQRLKDCVLLKWDKVDFNRKRIRVKQFKTEKEVTIPIAAPLLDVLRDSLIRKDETNYVSPVVAARYNKVDARGKNIGNNLVGLDVLRVIRWIGLEPSVEVEGRKRKATVYGFHSLRHSFASHCAEAGVPKAVLLSILGTDSDIADKFYTHVGEEAQEKAIAAITGSVANTIPSAEDRLQAAIAFISEQETDAVLEKLLKILKGQ